MSRIKFQESTEKSIWGKVLLTFLEAYAIIYSKAMGIPLYTRW
jgi:hypothetical protein